MFAGLLQETDEQLADFLEKNIATRKTSRWEHLVLNKLTEHQRRVLDEKGGGTISDLDLAQKLRVFDGNWFDLKNKVNPPSKVRNYLKEMQSVRNDWAHMTSRGIKTEDLKRYLSTMGKFLEGINASKQLLERVKKEEADLWRTPSQNSAIDSTVTIYNRTNAIDASVVATNLEKGRHYTREQIREVIGGGSLQSFLPTKNGQVLAVCANPAKNPNAPEVLLVGNGPRIKSAAASLVNLTEAIPVFMKQRKNEWLCEGRYFVERVSYDQEEIYSWSAKATRQDDVTAAVFLRASHAFG